MRLNPRYSGIFFGSSWPVTIGADAFDQKVLAWKVSVYFRAKLARHSTVLCSGIKPGFAYGRSAKIKYSLAKPLAATELVPYNV